MDHFLLALILIVCYSIYHYFYKKLNYFKSMGIPHHPPTFLFGNMKEVIFRRKHLQELIRETYNLSPEAKYVGHFQFMRPIVIIKDLDLIKTIAIKNFDHFMDHKSALTEGIDIINDLSIFNLTGERWRRMRHLLSPSTSTSKLKETFGLIVKFTENFIDYIGVHAENPKNMIFMKDLFMRYASDLMAMYSFGISVDSLRDPNNEFYLKGISTANLRGMNLFKATISSAFPNLMRTFNYKFMSDEIIEYYINIVNTVVKMREEKQISRPDLLQLMINARENKKELNIEEMASQAFTFYFGGLETNTTQMCLMAQELAINPDIQKRLQNEIDEVLKKTNGMPTYEAIIGMPYLDAIFNESLRYYSLLSILGRVCTKTFELPPALPGGKPLILQPGMGIWFPLAGINMDPNYYEDPEKFNPERYYEKKMSVNNVLTMNFGIGPRSCLGYKLASLINKTVIFYLLAKYNLKSNEKTCIPFKYDLNSVLPETKGGFWLSFDPRSDKVY